MSPRSASICTLLFASSSSSLLSSPKPVLAFSRRAVSSRVIDKPMSQHLAKASSDALASLPPLNTSDGTAVPADTLGDTLKGKRVALFFSAGWCPMCTSFEPSLLRFREAAASSKKDVAIIYVPSDRAAADVATRARAMGMLSVPVGAAADGLKQRHEIWAGAECGKLGTGRRSGVPALVVLDAKKGEEMAFLPAEADGARALEAWPLDDERGVW